jgi:hypothetical protein
VAIFRRTARRVDLQQSSLAPAEAFLLSRLGGGASLAELADLTGLDVGRVDAAMSRLVDGGYVAADGAEALSPTPTLTPLPPMAVSPSRAPRAPAKPEDAIYTNHPSQVPLPPAEAPDMVAPELIPILDLDAADVDEVALATDAEDSLVAADVDAATHRQLYARLYAHLTRDERVALAQKASREAAIALAYDPDPQVIRVLCEHFREGLEPLRVIAAHHVTAQGLDALLKRVDALRDGLVERRLLRNAHISEAMLRTLLARKRLLKLFQVVVDRDLPEITRVRSRGVLRAHWPLSTPEERAELLVVTEGRCLPQFVGLTFDQRLISLLCARPIHSPVFVQSLARFSATPPQVLLHLLKQPLVKRSSHLRLQVQQHPNAPAEAKRM